MAQDDGSDPTNEIPADGLHVPLETASIVDEAHEEFLPSRQPFRTIFRAIGVLEQVFGSLLLLLILVLVLTQVAQRYIPGSWPWTGELARFSLVWATFLMAGYLMAHHPRHIAIELVDHLVRGRWLAVVKLFVNLVILLTCLVLLYGTYNLIATDIGQVTPAAQIPMRYVNAVPLVGLFLIALRAVLGILINDVPALRNRSGDAE